MTHPLTDDYKTGAKSPMYQHCEHAIPLWSCDKCLLKRLTPLPEVSTADFAALLHRRVNGAGGQITEAQALDAARNIMQARIVTERTL